MTPHRRLVIGGAALAGLLATAATAEIRTPALIGDGMVIQRDAPVRLWGWGDPGEEIRARLAEHSASATTDPSGRWSLELAALPAGGPHVLTLAAANTLRFSDVYVGEVWIASGQSNMEWPLSSAQGADAFVAGGCEGLRLFKVARATATGERDDVEGSWRRCDADSAPSFSAVALFFGRALGHALDVPIGLIQSAWGGTPAEAWTARAAIGDDPAFASAIAALDAPAQDVEELREEYLRATAAWEAENFPPDPANVGRERGWARPDFDDAGWTAMALPQHWESAGLTLDGVVWFRRVVDVPEAWAGRELTLSLGAVDDFDTTYFDGVEVGATGNETARYWEAPRRYAIPGSLVRAGRNVVAVRVYDHYGNGGFGGDARQMSLTCGECGDDAVSLAGEWSYAVESEIEPPQPDFATQPRPPAGIDDPNSPTVLYNAMIAPLTPYRLRGAIWYQGESNAGRAWQYRTLFPTMIQTWREAWELPELPFLFVQLANFMARQDAPAESQWAELREAQLLASQQPHNAMAVTIDVGNGDDIHPRNKRDVGHRLYLAALATVYGKEVEHSGPTYAGMSREDGAIRLRFEHAAGLAPRGGAPLTGFAIAGDDRRFRWAEARVDGESVVVSHPEVPEPVAARYGWADNPECNLHNGAGLPASPFRTDDWPGLTGPSSR